MSESDEMDVATSLHLDREPDPRVGELVGLGIKLTEAMGLMSDHLRALVIVNTTLLGALRNHVDIKQIRKVVLTAFTDETEDRNAIAHVNAMLGPPRPDESPPSESEMRDRLQDIARSRFTIIEGGRSEEL